MFFLSNTLFQREFLVNFQYFMSCQYLFILPKKGISGVGQVEILNFKIQGFFLEI